ncbi:MAG: hypothetical protein WC402_02990 [Candidatus Pacearchaeota archaeon]|jgi:hypothetical protein
MTNIWISQLLPIELIEILPALTLIIIGLIVEKKYVGRVAIFANAIALSTFFYKIQNLPLWTIWYINILTIFGLIAIFSYAFKIKLPQEYYWLAGVFSSVVSGILLFWGMTLK